MRCGFAMSSSSPKQGCVPRLAVATLCLVLAGPLFGAGRAAAEAAGADPGVRVPGFWDPRRRPEKPDMSRINGIRFLTEIDDPPFNFSGPGGHPPGFEVAPARIL